MEKQVTNSVKGKATSGWLHKVGFVGVLFFLIKGIIWIALGIFAGYGLF